MASDTTFLQATNAILRALGSVSVATANFADPTGTKNAREIRAAKEILLEAWRETENKLPDSWWETSTEIELLGYTTGTFTAAPVGKVFTVDTVPSDTTHAEDYFFAVSGFDQWYKVDTLSSGPDEITIVSDFQGSLSFPNTYSYTLTRLRWPLPSNFRDVLNVFAPNTGVDVIKTSVEDIVERMSTEGYARTHRWPLYYAIGYNEETTPEPSIYFWPYPKRSVGDPIIFVRYQRKQTVPSAAADTFDCEEDAMSSLINRAKAQALIEVNRDVQGAAFYKALEEEKRQDQQTKERERARPSRLRPNMVDYRDFYKDAVKSERERRLWIQR